MTVRRLKLIAASARLDAKPKPTKAPRDRQRRQAAAWAHQAAQSKSSTLPSKSSCWNDPKGLRNNSFEIFSGFCIPGLT